MSDNNSYYISFNYYVAKRIRNLREDRDITQKEVADYLQMTRQAYSKIENGVTIINLDVLATLAQVFQVKIADFFPPSVLNNPITTTENVVEDVANSPYAKSIDPTYIRTCDIVKLVSLYSLLPLSEREAILEYLETKTHLS